MKGLKKKEVERTKEDGKGEDDVDWIEVAQSLISKTLRQSFENYREQTSNGGA